jgi:large subunit ribosomal protein L29
MKNNTEIRELSLAELKDRINEEIFQQDKLRFNHTVSTLENPMKLRHGRRLVARLKTELRNRDLNQNTAK